MTETAGPGYVRTKPVLALTFADGLLEGLVVRLRSQSATRFLEFSEVLQGIGKREAMNPIIDELVEHLIGWNMVDEDGEPVPATRDELMAMPIEWVTTLALHWMETVSGRVTGGSPLGVSSPSGVPSAAAVPVLPMESL
jgi:hypothetical protein